MLALLSVTAMGYPDTLGRRPMRHSVGFGGQTQENPDIHCATASNEQLHIVRKTLGITPRATFTPARFWTDA
jgi:hypothetical protein